MSIERKWSDGQLQEGLLLYLIRSPSVSGAMTYLQLFMATKHKEKRKTEVKKVPRI